MRFDRRPQTQALQRPDAIRPKLEACSLFAEDGCAFQEPAANADPGERDGGGKPRNAAAHDRHFHPSMVRMDSQSCQSRLRGKAGLD